MCVLMQDAENTQPRSKVKMPTIDKKFLYTGGNGTCVISPN